MNINQQKSYINKLIAEIPFCALDFETTQLPNSTKELAIIEIGAQKFSGNKLAAEKYHTLVNPQCDIRSFDTGVSGITNQMVVNKPCFLEVKKSFFSYIEDCVIIAHNASFDKRALESQCKRDDCSMQNNIYIDSIILLRKLVKLKKYSLESVAQYYAIDHSVHHRAYDDCKLLIKVFWNISKSLDDRFGIRYFRDLCRLIGIETSEKGTQGTLFD